MNDQQNLSKSVIAISKQSGNEIGWHIKDLPIVFEDAKNSKVANLGGQLQYILPDGTCELYWISIEPEYRLKNESWSDWVDRSYTECLTAYNETLRDKSFIKDAVSSFSILKNKVKSGIDIAQYEYFILYFETNK